MIWRDIRSLADAVFTAEDVANLQEDINDEWSDTEHRRWLISLKDRIERALLIQHEANDGN